jgi:lipopolysaccharide biosynthesis glycosyltransferase
MNALLWNRWEELNPAWNVQVGAFYRQQGLLDDEHRPELYVDVIKKPKVIHYNTDNKPWLPGCIHPLRGEYFRHLKRTAWQGTRPNELAYRLRKSASKIYRYFRPKKTSPSSDPR